MTPACTRVDVVVVAYNSRDTLRECVEPLSTAPWVRVIVVDNASPDDSADAVTDLPVDVVRAPRNGGFGYGCNLGMAASDAQYVLLLNPDARFTVKGLEVLVRVLDENPEIGVVGPRIVDQNGALMWSQRRFPRLRSTFGQALLLHRMAPRSSWSDEVIRDRSLYERPQTPEWMSGACLLLRREAVASVGGFDESFFLYSEEVDLFRRMRSKGWTARYEPSAIAVHEGGGSAPRHTTKRIWARSRVRYATKHHGPWVGALEAVGVAVGAAVHAVAWVHRPAIARGHVSAGLAAIAAIWSERLPSTC